MCECRTETQRHVLSCKHPNSRENYKPQLLQAKHHLPSSHIMPWLWDILTKHLAYSLGCGPEPTTNVPLADRYGLKLSIEISEQEYTGWPNATKGFISPMWGELQYNYYCEQYPDPNDCPKHLSAIVFKMKLVQAMWIMFQGIWKQRNDILHN